MTEFRDWYDALQKPGWTPDPSLIGTIWSVLYPLIIASLIWVVWGASKGRWSWWVVLPFAVNLLANIVFTPIQFGLRNLPLATADIILVLITIIISIVVINPYSKILAGMQIPYLVWVATATVLQTQITWMNR